MGQPISNKLTTGAPIYGVGNTGGPSIVFIPAARLYIKAPPDTVNGAPVQNYYTKYGGTTPAGFTDLGVIENVKIPYTKNYTDVQLGIDKRLYASYVSESKMEFTADLLQFDDYIVQQVLGLTPSIITPGSMVSFPIGQEAFAPRAMLIVFNNKIDGKECHFYHPAAPLDGAWDDSNDRMILKVTAKLPLFVAAGDTSGSGRYTDYVVKA